jgi:ribosomal protein S6
LNTYQALLILYSSLNEDALNKALETVREEIDKLEGRVHGSRSLGKRMFARPMSKQESGFYARVGFSIDPQRIEALRARLKLVEAVFRVQVTRAREEDVQPTVSEDKPAPESAAGPAAGPAAEPAAKPPAEPAAEPANRAAGPEAGTAAAAETPAGEQQQS